MTRYCGRDFTPQELEQIRKLIAEDAGRTRAELSRLTCRMLDWFKPDGGLKDMSCRVAMLRMAEDGLINLPPPRCKPPRQKISFTRQTDPQSVIIHPIHELAAIQLCPVVTREHSRVVPANQCSLFIINELPELVPKIKVAMLMLPEWLPSPLPVSGGSIFW